MQPREKKLAIVFGGVMVFMLLKPMIADWFFKPIETARTDIERETATVEKLESDVLDLNITQQLISRLTLRSLPYDELAAQRQYQEWLTDLLQIYQIQDVKVDPAPISNARSKSFISVRIDVTGSASYEQICRFLLAFENTALLHRMNSLNLTSEEHTGNPRIQMRLTAEGIALPKSMRRETLFPRFQLAEPLPVSGTTLTAKSPEGFPATGSFLMRVDQELVEVTAIKGNQWTLVRGCDKTKVVEHPAGAEVELFRLRSDRLLIPEPEINRIVADNFFLKPIPPVKYEPKLTPIGDKEIVRTVPTEFRLQVTGFSPETPPRRFLMEDDIPPGLTIDETTGVVKWTPQASTAAGPYPVTFSVLVEGESEPRLGEFVVVTLIDLNLPPKLAEVEPQTAIAGSELQFQLAAEDPEEGSLTYTLEGEIPEGATLDPATGMFRWKPAEDAIPADLQLVVKVTDAGSPPLSDSRNLTIAVVEDFTKEIFLTGVLNRGEDRQAMLYNRAENVTTILKEGFPFQAGGVRGRVTEVGRDFVLWQSGSELWRLMLGENLHSRIKDRTLAVEPTPEPVSTSTVPGDTVPLVAPKP